MGLLVSILIHLLKTQLQGNDETESGRQAARVKRWIWSLIASLDCFCINALLYLVSRIRNMVHF